jgi:hypothetical protein
MLAARLISLIETHAASLTQETMEDILTNDRTRSFARLPKDELESRISALFQNLSKWIGAQDEDAIREEYEHWGRTRFREGIPLREIIYVLILSKRHLRRFIREHGLVAFSGDQVTPGELVPLELYSIQELNYMIGDFFDQALYSLASGYEAAAKSSAKAARPAA